MLNDFIDTTYSKLAPKPITTPPPDEQSSARPTRPGNDFIATSESKLAPKPIATPQPNEKSSTRPTRPSLHAPGLRADPGLHAHPLPSHRPKSNTYSARPTCPGNDFIDTSESKLAPKPIATAQPNEKSSTRPTRPSLRAPIYMPLAYAPTLAYTPTLAYMPTLAYLTTLAYMPTPANGPTLAHTPNESTLAYAPTLVYTPMMKNNQNLFSKWTKIKKSKRNNQIIV